MGCGTAQIRNRSYRAVEDKPQATGVPTGWSVASGGFNMMDQDVKECIDIAFERIAMLCDKDRDKCTLVYSCDKNDEAKIGTGTFCVVASVLDYISVKLANVCAEVEVKRSVPFDLDEWIGDWAQLKQRQEQIMRRAQLEQLVIQQQHEISLLRKRGHDEVDFDVDEEEVLASYLCDE